MYLSTLFSIMSLVLMRPIMKPEPISTIMRSEKKRLKDFPISL